MLTEEFCDPINDKDLELCEDIEKGERIKYLHGVIARANYANQNKRIYPYEVMKEAIDEIIPLVQSRRFVGELDHTDTPKISLERVALYIPRIELKEDGTVIGDIYPTSTEKGNILKGLLSDGIRIGFSTRATGSVKPYNGPLGEGLLEVNKGMRLISVDAVMNPSVKDALPDIVTEDRIYLGQTVKFKQVWEDVFGK
jgi:hypothetical protein